MTVAINDLPRCEDVVETVSLNLRLCSFSYRASEPAPPSSDDDVQLILEGVATIKSESKFERPHAASEGATSAVAGDVAGNIRDGQAGIDEATRLSRGETAASSRRRRRRRESSKLREEGRRCPWKSGSTWFELKARRAGGRGARALFRIPMADTVIPSGGIRIFLIFKFKTLSHRSKNNHEVT